MPVWSSVGRHLPVDRNDVENIDQPRRHWSLSVEVWVLVFVLGAIGCALVFFQWTRAIDDLFYDQVQRFVAPALPEDVAVVAIDERSLNALGRWPWPRSRVAALVEKLGAIGVRSVAVDVVFAESSTGDPGGDAALAAALESLPVAILPVVIDRLGPGGQAIEVLPIPPLAAVAKMGHVHIEYDTDGIARGIYLYRGVGEAFWPHFSLALSETLGEVELRRPPATSEFNLRPVRDEYRRIPFGGGPERIGQTSAVDVLTDDAVARLLVDKVVFVGVIATAADDSVLTPLSESDRPMSGVEFNAHTYSAIRTNRLITPIDFGWQLGLTVLLCLAAPMLLPRFNPRWSLLTTLALAMVPIVLSMVMLGFRIWFAPLAATITTLVAYPLWSWRRLDNTFRYLMNDLNLLNLEADRLPVDTDNRELSDSIEFLARVHEIDDWGVYQRGRAERKTPGAPEKPPAMETVGVWETTAGGIWLRTPSEPPLLIGLIAPSEVLQKSTVEAGLRQVHDAFIEMPARRGSAYEVVGTLLRRVGRSASRVRMLRQIVADSLAHMGDGMLLIDGFGRVVLANEIAARLTCGDGSTNIVGRSVHGVLAEVLLEDGETWTSLARRTLVGGESIKLDATAPRGRSLLVHVSQVDLGAPIGRAMIVNLVDITALRDAEHQRSETLAFLSHDLRSPMVSLLALVNRHRRSGDVVDAELLDRVESYAKRNLDSSDKFLQLARLQGSEKIEFYDFEVTDVLHNAVEQVYFQAEEKGNTIDVALHAEESDGIWLHGNAELLERALINLIDNANKYSPPGSRITTSATQVEEHILLTVTDEGYGIPASEHDALFEAFYRVPDGRTRRERGTGLGLPFVKAVAERHNGRVEVDSAPGRGSRFQIVLPAVAFSDLDDELATSP